MRSDVTLLVAFLLLASSASAQVWSPTKPVATLEELEAQADVSPENADLLRRLASAHAVAGRLDLALAAIDRARTIAPDDLDIRLARARILLWSGNRADARAEADAVTARDPLYPELADIRAALARPVVSQRPGLAASIGRASVDLSGGSQVWTTLTGTGFMPLKAGTIASVTIDVEARRNTDVRFTARIDGRLSKGEVYAAIAATPKADFRERLSIAGGMVYPVRRGLDATIGLRHARYAGVSVTVAEPGVRLRLAGDRLIVSGKWINLFRSDDGHRSGVAVRSDLSLGSDRVLFAGGASYPDTEAGVTRQVRALYAGVAIPISDQISFRFTGEHERRVASYTRRGATVGVVWRMGR